MSSEKADIPQSITEQFSKMNASLIKCFKDRNNLMTMIIIIQTITLVIMANILNSFKEDSSYRPVNMKTETEKLNINLESSLEEARTDEDDNKDMIFSILLFLLAIVVLVDNILTHKFYSSKLKCMSANKCTNLELEDDNAVKASQIGDINIENRNKARDEVQKEDRTGANNTNIDEQNNVSKVSEIHVNVSKVSEIHVKDMKNIDEEEGGVLKNNETSNVDEVKKEDNVSHIYANVVKLGPNDNDNGDIHDGHLKASETNVDQTDLSDESDISYDQGESFSKISSSHTEDIEQEDVLLKATSENINQDTLERGNIDDNDTDSKERNGKQYRSHNSISAISPISIIGYPKHSSTPFLYDETSDKNNDSKDSADKSKKKDDSNKSFLSRISRILSPHKSSTSSSSLERDNAKVANIKKKKKNDELTYEEITDLLLVR